MGSTKVGNWLKRQHLLATPEELQQPEIVRLHGDALAAIEPAGVSQPLFEQFLLDPALFHLHRSIQRTTNTDVRLSEPRQEEIKTVVDDADFSNVPEECRFDILCSPDLHQDFHVEQQVYQ
jgi:membrane glycosyltransferase